MAAEGVRELNDDSPPSDLEIERARFWIKYILDNLDDLVTKEQHAINLYGVDYNRDEEHDNKLRRIRLEFEE